MPRIRRGDPENLTPKCRLRSEMTFAERRLWSKLSRRQFLSLRFRRQHGIGLYIVDFYCAEKGIVIEVDGETHADLAQQLKDRQREKNLKSLGLQVIRYTNSEIIGNLEGVLEDLGRRV